MNFINFRAVVFSGVFFFSLAYSTVIPIGKDKSHKNIKSAMKAAIAGDTLEIFKGKYSEKEYLNKKGGISGKPILIYTKNKGDVIFNSSTEAICFDKVQHLRFENLIFEGQSINGVNIFDSDTAMPQETHNIHFKNCIFQDMTSGGNHDLLKISGVDTFIIESCAFINGAGGGSGIDMVGCHYGTIKNNRFENTGSNGIQAKGGTQFLTITNNIFKKAGARAINLGGSTGPQFFRPAGAKFEAADLKVFSNIFIECSAPIAYVGCERVQVINNTIYRPELWVVRILQESVDDRFVPCSNNSFINNIIYFGKNIKTECNVGPNTKPESFNFSNNMWYHFENSNWEKPNLPVTDNNAIFKKDPLLSDPSKENFHLKKGSPAIGKGLLVKEPKNDYYRKSFADPRVIGAIEFSNNDIKKEKDFVKNNNYSNLFIICSMDRKRLHIIHYKKPKSIRLILANGKRIKSKTFFNKKKSITSFDLSDDLNLIILNLKYENYLISKIVCPGNF